MLSNRVIRVISDVDLVVTVQLSLAVGTIDTNLTPQPCFMIDRHPPSIHTNLPPLTRTFLVRFVR